MYHLLFLAHDIHLHDYRLLPPPILDLSQVNTALVVHYTEYTHLIPRIIFSDVGIPILRIPSLDQNLGDGTYILFPMALGGSRSNRTETDNLSLSVLGHGVAVGSVYIRLHLLSSCR